MSEVDELISETKIAIESGVQIRSEYPELYLFSEEYKREINRRNPVDKYRFTVEFVLKILPIVIEIIHAVATKQFKIELVLHFLSLITE